VPHVVPFGAARGTLDKKGSSLGTHEKEKSRVCIGRRTTERIIKIIMKRNSRRRRSHKRGGVLLLTRALHVLLIVWERAATFVLTATHSRASNLSRGALANAHARTFLYTVHVRPPSRDTHQHSYAPTVPPILILCEADTLGLLLYCENEQLCVDDIPLDANAETQEMR
jgi:hypothetical protein